MTAIFIVLSFFYVLMVRKFASQSRESSVNRLQGEEWRLTVDPIASLYVPPADQGAGAQQGSRF